MCDTRTQGGKGAAMSRRLRGRPLGFSGTLVLLVMLLGVSIAGRQQPSPSTSPPSPVPSTAPAAPISEVAAACMACHEDKTLVKTFKDGSTMSLFVDLAHFRGSVHESQLTCTDCHAKYDDDHPMGTEFESRRAYTVGSY